MGIGVEFKDIDLDGSGKLEKKIIRNSKVYTSEFVVEAIRNYPEFYVDHGVHTFFKHARIDGNFYINLDEVKPKNLWGYVGDELGRSVGEVLHKRNDTYNAGWCMLTFGNAFSIAGLKRSKNPKVKVDIKIDSERISQQEIKEFLENFSSEAGIDIFLISYPLQLITSRYLSVNRNDAIYHIGSTDEEHHLLEAAFKSLGNAFNYFKSKRSTPIIFIPTLKRQRVVYKERNTHETRISLELNLDGTGKDELDFTCTLPSEIVDSFKRAHSYMIQAATFETKGRCIGNDEHHLVEDSGIAEGRAISKGLEKRKTIKGIMRYGFDVQMCDSCGSLAAAAIDIIKRPCYTANLPSHQKRQQQLFSHYFEQLFENSGIDGYLTISHRDQLKEIFDEEISTNLLDIWRQDSPYQSAPNSIKGTYSLQTKCDDEHHQNELLFVAVGKALKQATRIDRLRASYLPTTKGLI